MKIIQPTVISLLFFSILTSNQQVVKAAEDVTNPNGVHIYCKRNPPEEKFKKNGNEYTYNPNGFWINVENTTSVVAKYSFKITGTEYKNNDVSKFEDQEYSGELPPKGKKGAKWQKVGNVSNVVEISVDLN